MKRFSAARTALCGLLASALLTVPAYGVKTVPVQVDGQHLETLSHLEDGVTYAPLRLLLDAFGGWEVDWDHSTGTARAVNGARQLWADPASDTVTLDGMEFPGRVYVENGRTYVPLRLVANLLGGSAVWDPHLGGAAVTSADADYDAQELYWLSRIISAESRGEPMEGQIAVGNVVLNRVDSEEFPDTIPGVIFDREHAIQFEPVENGTVYDAPAERSVDAAKRVLDGEKAVDDVLYFYAPALSQGIWINDNRIYSTTIGCHRFYL